MSTSVYWKTYRITCQAWWLRQPILTENGSVMIARCDAISTTQRYKKDKKIYAVKPNGNSELMGNDYSSGTLEQGYDGDYLSYMLDLTEKDLEEIKNLEGYNTLPEMSYGGSVDTVARPAGKPITMSKYQQSLDSLMIEGEIEPEKIDNTPYMKGDEYNF